MRDRCLKMVQLEESHAEKHIKTVWHFWLYMPTYCIWNASCRLTSPFLAQLPQFHLHLSLVYGLIKILICTHHHLPSVFWSIACCCDLGVYWVLGLFFFLLQHGLNMLCLYDHILLLVELVFINHFDYYFFYCVVGSQVKPGSKERDKTISHIPLRQPSTTQTIIQRNSPQGGSGYREEIHGPSKCYLSTSHVLIHHGWVALANESDVERPKTSDHPRLHNWLYVQVHLRMYLSIR